EDDPVFQFDMLPVKNQKNPGFINLQQFYLEEYLLDALEALPNVEVRWKNKVAAVTPGADGVRVDVETPDGVYQLDAEYLLACDGAKSPVRGMLGLDFQGRVFEDNFLIADVRFQQERPSERWFWFDPPFPGASALLHKQPDDVWRLDFQLGWDIDKAEAVKPENVDPFVRGMLGPDIAYEYEWLSVYTFQCRRMERFVHDRVIFLGDSAHLVSPFGARGCNGGVADADNLGWKLDLILRGAAPASLLESFNQEAIATADENILNSTRATDFITPKSEISQMFRDATLELAREHSFVRPFINSGRLSTPVSYADSPLSTPDADAWEGGVKPGAPMVDAPLTGGGWLSESVGQEFTLISFTSDGAPDLGVPALGTDAAPVRSVSIGPDDELTARRYGAAPGAAYLMRPDQYVAARWRAFDGAEAAEALDRATGAAA
ncbi:MAG: FAD-dependent monooxygenase, partial [Pseudomonadota bacterium]